jgi:hypothetical protein
MRQVPLIIEPDPEDPYFATVMVDGSVAGRPYRFILDTGAVRTLLGTDEYTASLTPETGDVSFSAFGGSTADPVVTVTDLAAGPLGADTLAVTRAGGGGPGPGPGPGVRNLLGMDVLGRYCCHFRLDAGVLELDAPPGYRADHDLLMSGRGHVYVELRWPGVTGQACWDTGSGATIVSRDFWLANPGLFEEIGTSAGTDSSGAQSQTPVLMMTGPVIGGRAFAAHRVVAVDLSRANSTLEYPMDFILGYPTLRQAGWLFDFPAKRWTLTD